MKIHLTLAARVAAALLVATCAAILSAQTTLTIPGTTPAVPAGLAPPPADKVVATVDGKDVTFGDLKSMLVMAPPAVQRNPQLALQQYFIMRYLAAEGDKLKLGEQSPLKEEIEFQRNNILAGAMLNFQRETSTVKPGAVEDYYKVNLDKYQQAKIKVIFVAFKPAVAGSVSSTDDLARAAQDALAQAHSGTDRSEAQAKALAEDIVKRARGGEDFLALVGKYSDDAGSKAAQGDFGVIKHDSTAYPEDLKKAVFALETGKISDPLRQGAGFYIVRLEDKSPQPLTEVGPDILQNLRQLTLNDWFAALNNRFKPDIKDPAAFVIAGPNGAMPSALPQQ